MTNASVNSFFQSNDGSSSMCLELALEGERLCKSGDCRAGVAFFQVRLRDVQGLSQDEEKIISIFRLRFSPGPTTCVPCRQFTASSGMLTFTLETTQRRCSTTNST